ncbi:hypothetical protein C3L33_17396, partial [Rhododendron williamsianum]
MIELNFCAEFEISIASEEYKLLIKKLPEVFVGKVERLQNLIKILCSAAKKCMKEKKMHMAPWRKHKYLQAKWLNAAACERTAAQPLVAAAGFPAPIPHCPFARRLIIFDLIGGEFQRINFREYTMEDFWGNLDGIRQETRSNHASLMGDVRTSLQRASYCSLALDYFIVFHLVSCNQRPELSSGWRSLVGLEIGGTHVQNLRDLESAKLLFSGIRPLVGGFDFGFSRGEKIA